MATMQNTSLTKSEVEVFRIDVEAEDLEVI